MNESEWNDLQRLWKSCRLRRPNPSPSSSSGSAGGGGGSPSRSSSKRSSPSPGLSVGVALIARGGTFFVVTGIATCAFVAAVCALSLWARLRAAAAPRGRRRSTPSPSRGSTRASVCGTPRPRSGGSSSAWCSWPSWHSRAGC